MNSNQLIAILTLFVFSSFGCRDMMQNPNDSAHVPQSHNSMQSDVFDTELITSYTFEVDKKHLRFNSDGMVAVTLFDSTGLPAALLEHWKIEDNKLFLWSIDERDLRVFEFHRRHEDTLEVINNGNLEVWTLINEEGV